MSCFSHDDAPLPAHMAGHLAPVPDEIDALDLPVEGALPPELTGRYLRNGPNPLPGEPSRHWFVGHGMLHGIRLREGRAEWYRNRWVRTKALQGESMIDSRTARSTAPSASRTPTSSPHAGRIMALVESSFPHAAHPRARHGRPVRLRRPPHHGDDRAPQDRPGHR